MAELCKKYNQSFIKNIKNKNSEQLTQYKKLSERLVARFKISAYWISAFKLPSSICNRW